MNHTSLELIPRTLAEFDADLRAAKKYPAISAVNVPDLLRFPVRSWDAASTASAFYPKTIPHIRAVDIGTHNREQLIDNLVRTETKTVLVVRGDIPNTYGRAIFPTTTIEIIEWLRKKLPSIEVYAALDPYRTGFRQEMAYAMDKMSAGACGFFTQPFFDLRLLEIWAEQLQTVNVFWGVAPVVSERSTNYWEVKGNVLFPRNFETSLVWNQEFARSVIEWTRKYPRCHTYLMPIKVDIDTYLKGVFV